MLTAWLAGLAWFLPAGHALGIQPPREAAAIWDVRLGENGLLRGRMVDLDGRAVPGETIQLRRSGRTLAEVASSKGGEFAFSGVAGGVYQIHFAPYTVNCRAWTAAAAPPVAKDQLVVLSAPPAVRGQQPIQALYRSPLFIGLVIAAAVAIPIAIHNANDDDPSGS